MCDALDSVAGLCTALQSKSLDFAEFAFIVDACISDLQAMVDSPDEATEYFKTIDSLLSTDLKDWNLQVTDEVRSTFKRVVFIPYFNNLIDNIKGRFTDSAGIITAFSIFDPRHLPNKESELGDYGLQELDVILAHYGQVHSVEFNGDSVSITPDITRDDMVSEWRIFKRLLYGQYKSYNAQDMTSSVLASESQCLMFPNIVKILQIYQIIPLTTATVERSFSTLKLVKTNLRSRLKDCTLDWCMRIAIEGPDSLTDDDIEAIISIWKQKNLRRLAV